VLNINVFDDSIILNISAQLVLRAR